MQDPAVKHLIGVLLADQRTRYSGPLERFLRMLSTEQGKESWEAWKRSEVTMLFLGALKALAETGAAGVDTTALGIALTHGVSCGVNMAVRLCEDPSRVFPAIFDGEEKLMGGGTGSDPVMENYSTPPSGEEEIDNHGSEH